MAFEAPAGVAYHRWVRLRAQNNATSNDSVHVQFSDSVDGTGAPTSRIGTTGSAEVVLQAGPSGADPKGWGWTDNGWGTAGPLIFFAAEGPHTIRVQQREDGAFVDQIVLSAEVYANAAPGARLNDTTVLTSTDEVRFSLLL
jgi:hypothetical protein